MTFYTTEARSTYVSVKVLFLILAVPLGFGGYTYAVAAAYLIALGYPLRWALIPGAITALAVWIRCVQLWWQMVRQIESDGVAMALGKVRMEHPVTIYYKQRTDGGMITSPRECPASPSQIRFVAKMVARGETPTTRNMRKMFTKDQASEYISWLVGEEHMAWKDEENHQRGAYVTDDGMAYFSQQANMPLVKPHSYSPSGDGWIPFD